jgi:phosphatidylethanolamine-binding protein (PEBP) family uncharacterized protein
MARTRWFPMSRLAPLAALALTLPLTCCGSTTAATSAPGNFALTSPAFVEGGTLPVVYTCDGAGHSPPFAWSGAPAGTAQFAILITTLANDGMRWNWVMYAIPASASALAESSVDVGTFGLTSDGPNLAYYPPCSQGPGAKTYTFTLYALAAAPAFAVPAAEVTGPVVTSAIAGLVLDSSRVSVTYTR